jgi:hypothetical protein
VPRWAGRLRLTWPHPTSEWYETLTPPRLRDPLDEPRRPHAFVVLATERQRKMHFRLTVASPVLRLVKGTCT